jgi:hypothetical protein
MVVVILKLEKSADEVPINWKLGVDWMKLNARTRDGEEIVATNDIDLYADNKDAMCTCTYKNADAIFTPAHFLVP